MFKVLVFFKLSPPLLLKSREIPFSPKGHSVCNNLLQQDKNKVEHYPLMISQRLLSQSNSLFSSYRLTHHNLFLSRQTSAFFFVFVYLRVFLNQHIKVRSYTTFIIQENIKQYIIL